MSITPGRERGWNIYPSPLEDTLNGRYMYMPYLAHINIVSLNVCVCVYMYDSDVGHMDITAYVCQHSRVVVFKGTELL